MAMGFHECGGGSFAVEGLGGSVMGGRYGKAVLHHDRD